MASLKILRGYESSLPQELSDGHIYFCTDSGMLYIDYTEENGILSRKAINANDAKTLAGLTIDDIILFSTQIMHSDMTLFDILETYILNIVDGNNIIEFINELKESVQEQLDNKASIIVKTWTSADIT